jgi:hypothetical protein
MINREESLFCCHPRDGSGPSIIPGPSLGTAEKRFRLWPRGDCPRPTRLFFSGECFKSLVFPRTSPSLVLAKVFGKNGQIRAKG